MRSLLALFVAAVPAFASAQGVSVTFPNPLARPHMSYTMTSQAAPIVIRADRILDGRGNVIPGGDVVVENGKITRVDKTATGTRDVRSARASRCCPGLIDAHSHLTWYFNRQGRYHTGGDGDTPVRVDAVDGGQRVRDADGRLHDDSESRDRPRTRICATGSRRRQIPGPRVLTSLNRVQQRATRRRTRCARSCASAKPQGADVIKIFASASIRDGGAQTMSDEQLAAICGEAKAQGLRTMVHAHSAESIKASVLAGCNQIEHGVFANDEVLKLMADQRRLLRSADLSRLPQLPRQPRQVRRHRQLQRGGLRGDGEGDSDRGRDVQARASTRRGSRSSSGPTPSPARTDATPKSSCVA